jgi:hypothetical protein
MRAARPAITNEEGKTMKAVSCWKDGEKWYMLRDTDGSFSHAVASREEAVSNGATVFVELDEPRFLVRDESGRGCASELDYSDFTAEEREHIEDEDEPDDTFGEWLDNSSAGDEYENTDENYRVIRIN